MELWRGKPDYILMPWQNPQYVPFTRIGVVSQVPSQSGVFGLLAGDRYVLVADSWNLKARLLDLINSVAHGVEFTVVYELCPEDNAERRRMELHKQLIPAIESIPEPQTHSNGLTFWSAPDAPVDFPTDGTKV